MAVTAVSLSTQLSNKLKDEDVPLEQRLDVAKIVFTSTTVPILQKEEIILEHLISSFNSNENIACKHLILKTIHSCLCSQRMQFFVGIIRPSVISDLLKILGSIKDHEELKICLVDSIIKVLSNKYFQRLFACDITELCELMSKLLNSATINIKDKCIEAIGLFLFINKMSLLKEDMRIRFIQEVFVPVCYAWTATGDDDNFRFREKIIQCVIQVVLFESSFVNELLKKPATEAIHKCDNKMWLAANKINKLSSECKVQVVSACYTSLLRAFIAKKVIPGEEDYKLLFNLFEHLAKQLGLTVDKVRSVSIHPIEGWETDGTFRIISDMIKVLDEAKIPLKMDFEGYSLETWMISLVIGMTSINLTTLTPALLDMVEAAFRLNPLIIEPCADITVQIMLRPKTMEVQESYKRMMLAAIDGAHQVKRLQKFISFLLAGIRPNLMARCEDSLVVDEVIPAEIGEAFSTAVETFTNVQALSTMKALLFHLESDSLAHAEASCIDNTLVINTEIIVVLMTKLIFGVKYADHSVPDVTKAKFKSQLEDLSNLLRKFGEISEIYQRTHCEIIYYHCYCYNIQSGNALQNDRLLRSYMQLCHTYGEIQLLFEEYEGSQMKPLTNFDLKPTNLCYVHPYFTPDQWRRLYKKVMAHEGCLAKNEMLQLLVQKISAVAQIEVGTEGPGSQAARYLLEMADLEWMWSHVVALAPLFQAMELDNLIKRLVKSCKNDQSRWKTLINKNGDHFLENRQLVLATGVRLLQRAGKIISHSSQVHSLTSEVMSHLMVDQMLEYELSNLITEDLELALQLDTAAKIMASLVEATVVVKKEDEISIKIPHQSYFEVVKMLPLHHFSLPNQSCILLSIISLLYDLPTDDVIDIHLLDVLYNILDGPQKHSYKLLGHLDPGLLIRFLNVRAKNYPNLKELISSICSTAVNDRDTAKLLLKSVSKPDKDTLWITILAIQALKKMKKISEHENNEDDDEEEEDMPPRKKPLNKKECVNSLAALAVTILLEEVPSLQLLPDYAVILKHELGNKSLGKLDLLLTKLKEYSEIAIKDYTSSGGGLIKVMMCHRHELGEHFPKVLISEVKRAIETEQCSGLERALTLWGYLIQNPIAYKKNKLRIEGLVNLVNPVTDLITNWSTENACLDSVAPLLGFYCTLTPLLWMELRPVLIDTILLSLSAVPLTDTNSVALISRLNLVVDTLFSLYLFRTSLVLDRLPAILQRYRSCLFALAPLAEVSLENVDSVMTVAGKLERVARTMVKRAKDFTRVAPYIVADVVGIFGKFQIHVDVKIMINHVKRLQNQQGKTRGLVDLSAFFTATTISTHQSKTTSSLFYVPALRTTEQSVCEPILLCYTT
uniref:Uncharacterized protein n=1 Tax=Rhodnius prolixus TaxID=13249 RepID=T1ICM8_RHOPR